MTYVHAMIRVANLEASLHFYQDLMGLKLLRRKDSANGRFSQYYLASAQGRPEIELTYHWDQGGYVSDGAFGHMAFQVDDVYATCQRLTEGGVPILRPPRDGYSACVKDPSGVSIELQQIGHALPPLEPWASMPSSGSW